ncbi:MAG: ABC transporter ATP-binding protein [Paenibacillus sp.]|jgi:ABC-2 type transport system ATP-binding protein|uniref:ABC transporter ATP-binding protein n=1 Tax=Paenibacillus sp. TaxID=58172 RepID=UPI0028FF349E|nr:ABC transporter ATP-binding protein [Paenibacillus sp.]MDU2240840.1 ABC transporter ATP-binding protein [Paenibacillus sp.]
MIRIEGLRERPAGGFVLQIDRLQLKPGLTLLVGVNGAGKTTLLELLATVNLPHRGEILYQERSALADLPLVRSQIGYMPSEVELYENMTPHKLLLYLSEMKGVFHAERTEELLRDFRLELYRNTKIKRLSGGVRRRITLAQSLLAAPGFLFLDEPLNGMDTAERKLAIAYLNRYAEGRTVIAAVHELSEWEEAADQVLWLDRGKVRFYGGKTSWMADLPYKVWEGVLTREQFDRCPEAGLIEFRETAGGIHAKLVGEAPLFPGLSECAPTFEDAYFIRKYQPV